MRLMLYLTNSIWDWFCTRHLLYQTASVPISFFIRLLLCKTASISDWFCTWQLVYQTDSVPDSLYIDWFCTWQLLYQTASVPISASISDWGCTRQFLYQTAQAFWERQETMIVKNIAMDERKESMDNGNCIIWYHLRTHKENLPFREKEKKLCVKQKT